MNRFILAIPYITLALITIGLFWEFEGRDIREKWLDRDLGVWPPKSAKGYKHIQKDD